MSGSDDALQVDSGVCASCLALSSASCANKMSPPTDFICNWQSKVSDYSCEDSHNPYNLMFCLGFWRLWALFNCSKNMMIRHFSNFMGAAYKHNFDLMTADKTWLHRIDFILWLLWLLLTVIVFSVTPSKFQISLFGYGWWGLWPLWFMFPSNVKLNLWQRDINTLQHFNKIRMMGTLLLLFLHTQQ